MAAATASVATVWAVGIVSGEILPVSFGTMCWLIDGLGELNDRCWLHSFLFNKVHFSDFGYLEKRGEKFRKKNVE